MTCRLCGSPLEVTFVDLGHTPLANSYPPADADPAAERRFPLHARVCEQCMLVQLDAVVPAEDIFEDYAYLSSYSSSWVEHARAFALEARDRFGLDTSSLVVEVASNDGYLLQHFVDMGIAVLGVEPARNVAKIAEERGIPTEVAFFGSEVAGALVDRGRQAELLVANNVLAHVPDLNDFVAGMARVLAPDGVLSIEFPHLLRLIEQCQFDTIYHEHYSYFSLLSAERALARHGLRVFDVQQLPTHGGSLRVLAAHADATRPTGAGADEVRSLEAAAGLDRIEAYAGFPSRVQAVIDGLRGFLRTAVADGATVVGYGAAAKANTLLNACGITTDDLAFVVDRNPLKQGRVMPGTRLPILDPTAVDGARPDFVVVLAWNLVDEIVADMARIRSWGGRFVVPVPAPRILP